MYTCTQTPHTADDSVSQSMTHGRTYAYKGFRETRGVEVRPVALAVPSHRALGFVGPTASNLTAVAGG